MSWCKYTTVAVPQHPLCDFVTAQTFKASKSVLHMLAGRGWLQMLSGYFQQPHVGQAGVWFAQAG